MPAGAIEPLTADFIAFHAAERPGALALVNNGRRITYAEFDRDVRKFSHAVRKFGLPRGGSVAVGCNDFYLHWLLLLAFEHLGIATASFLSSTQMDAPLLTVVDLVLAEPHFPVASTKPHRRITGQWLQDILASADADEGPAVSRGPDDPIRILQTSGTTGVSKRLLVSRQMHEARVSQNAFKYQLARESRYLVTMHFNVGVVYSCATACARLGATVVSDAFKNTTEVAGALSAHAITHVTLLPIQLQQILDDLPPDFEKPLALTIFTLGAAVSEPLRQKTLARLASGLCSGYGCNEVGIISFTCGMHDEGYESICPGVEIETVDGGGRRVPRGQMGEIRVKTACMADGYFHDPEATRRMFKDGWFHPGDMGILHGPRQLQVIGRGDELLNIGGNKFSPSALEALILSDAAVGDVGVTSVRNSEGIEEVHVAVVGATGDDAELLARISEALRHLQLGKFHVARLSVIPRNAAGKIRRDLLRSAVGAA
ncbi:MAG: class I adenylate-forming enzyme family protein [Acidobacteriota bacterium]